MSFFLAFITRPIATMLLAMGVLISGAVAYRFLPVAPLPSVDIPIIVVLANRPGADPVTMANSIAAPLERRMGEISGVTEITSTSSTGATVIVVQFELNRDIDGAARDVQAAINAATNELPSDLPTRPYYRKVNPADAPILTLALTSDVLSTAQVYDAVDTVLSQRLAQMDGVARVTVNGAEKPAVRVQLDPVRLAAAGVAGQDVLTAIRGANVNGPVGGFQGPDLAETIGLNGQISQAEDYAALVLKAGNGAILRVSDVATVVNGVANTRLAAWNGRQPAILLNVNKEAGANVIETVDRIKALLPQLMSWMPPDIKLTVIADRTTTIRASVDDVQLTLLITVALVLMVVMLFMRRLAPTMAAAVTVPLSIAGTLAGMWFLGFSLNNFTLMALTISVGFVVDDAIVMVENIMRHIEQGKRPLRAALDGARQIGFTVVSISASLVAVFIPVLFMGGIPGRLFHEFAMTLTLAILVSAAVSLTLTPMLCGQFIRPETLRRPARGAWGLIDRAVERTFRWMQRGYARSLGWSLRHRGFMLLVMAASVVFTVRLYGALPAGFLPEQDTRLMIGSTVASSDISFGAMAERQKQVVEVLLADPAIASVGSVIGVSGGWASLNRGTVYVSLKPLTEQHESAREVIERLRPALARVSGIQTYLYPAQDLRGGGRSDGSSYQFVVMSQDIEEMRRWTSALDEKLRQSPGVTDVSSDQDRASPQVDVMIDRDAAARLNVSTQAIDNALANAFAQRQVSIIYTQRNQYRVVLEVDPAMQRDPAALDRIYVGAADGTQIPLSAVARFVRGTTPLSVKHQSQFPAGTLSFSLPLGSALGDGIAAINAATASLNMPETVRTDFAGNAKLMQKSFDTMPLLLAASLVSIYVVLGVLYESWLHPLTILSTLPSAGLGALLALLASGHELSLIGFIGIILLMGIVKKNGILMIDFALEAERTRGLTPHEAIHEACLERFRPIMMTTMAALLGALPLALAFGTGAEFRSPLGISIAGGLIVSQLLTLYTTPAVYLALERLARPRRAIVTSAAAE